ncbi:exopolysaccharide biosynthesis protein [Alteromonas oceanisediminis]|uniref:exopolysaccharide biosynthesis protein n=1 Tax=Alteromonas oceanisediminis TaxID=2836180 RepID=UPI001BDAE52A|nr:exopolysaccharide biosynthesis protein [Alteromonas oceanisediminis]MBT0585260.1 exopolysaccharide biosynthesis protein [Alteromonas oceanisediminis]
MSDRLKLTDVLQKLVDDTEGSETSLGELINHLKSRGFGPLLLVPSLIAILPTGAIPGIPSACGITIFLIAIQLCYGDERPWLPKRLEDISIKRDKLKKGVESAKPYTTKIDAIFEPRMPWLTQNWVKRIIALLCGLTGLLMIPLEVLPFAAAVPGTAIALTAIGLTTEDGILITGGFVATVISAYLVYSQFLF